MKTRTISILLGAILLLGLVAVLADRSERTRHSSRASGRVLPGFEAAKAVKVEIKTKDKTAVLEKKDGAWKVSPEGFEADQTAVTEMLDKLAKAERAELASENPEKHTTLEVKEGETTGVEVSVWTSADAKPAAHLFVGKSGGDYQSNFVRLAGDNNVYRTRELIRPALDRPRGWRDHTIAKFVPEDVVRLDLRSDAGHWVIERAPDPAAPWTWVEPEPGPAIGAGVDGIVRALSNFQADEFPQSSDPVACGIAEPKARSLVVLKDGRTIDLLWGNEAQQGRSYIKRADSETIWEVASYKKNQAFPKIETLKAMPSPAPTPVATGEPSPAPPDGHK